jgi:hypothetical protein
MKKRSKIIFTKKALSFILEALGKEIDNKGFIIDSKTKKFVLDPDDEKIKASKLIAISKNDGFITNIFQINHEKI